MGLSHVHGGRRAESGAGGGVAGQPQDRPGQLALLVLHVHPDDGVLRQLGLVLEVGHHGRAALCEHAQERRRGLSRAGVAQVGHDVRRLDVRGQIRERHAAGHDREVARARPLQVGFEAAGVGYRADEQQPNPVVPRRRPRHRASHGLDPLLAGQQAEDAHDHRVVAPPEARPQRAHGRRVDRRGRDRHRDAGHLSPGQLRADRLGHEGVVDGDRPRGLDGDAEEGVGVRQQVPHGAQVGLEEPLAAAGVRVLELSPPCVERGASGLTESRARRLPAPREHRLGLEELRRPRVVQHEIVEHEQSRHPRQHLVDEVVGAAVAHLVDGEVVGALPVARHQVGGRVDG